VEKHPVTVIVMATMMEAKPFVLGMALEEKQKQPFRLFGKDTLVLAVSGIGKANAAMATAWCCERFTPVCVFNLGAAGASGPSHALGEIFHISRIVEYDRPRLITGEPTVHRPRVLDGFPTATLSTSDRAILDPEERRAVSRIADLIDMEGAAVVQACDLFDTSCCVFKFISDTPVHTEDEDVITNIRRYRTPFFEFFRRAVLSTSAGV